MLIDILVGIIISLGLGILLEVPVTSTWLILGAFFALLPDLDFFVEYFQRGTVGGKKLGSHRVLTHIPLFFLFPAVLLYIYFGLGITLLFALCIVWHFIHDSQGMGYGYRMLYPFSRKFFKFFSDKEGNYRYDTKHLLTSWTKEEVDALHAKHGNDDWVRDHVRYHSKKWFQFFFPHK